MALVFVLFALFASVFTVGKTALEFTQPFFLVGSRMLLAGSILLTYEYFKNPGNLKIQKKHFKLILLLATFNIYLTNTFEFWGLQYLSSFKACFIYSLSPFAAAIISYFVFSEKLSRKKWLGLSVGCVGFLPILIAQDSSETGLNHVFFFSLAEIAVLAACISSVYGWIILRQVVRDGGYSALTANGYSMLIGGSFALFHSAITESWDPIPTSNFTIFVETGLALIIISNFLAYNLYGYLLKRYSATFISFAGFTTPMFTALFGWMFLGEVVTWQFYVSSVIVFSGLYLFNQEELKVTVETQNA
ncbi:MAG: DMT family transporter [Chlamydiota bacterium]|nr:DMT family transporter [Chlamydiota bacterium]